MDKFRVEEKKALLKEVLEEIKRGVPVKERFQDLLLGSEVIRYPLQVNGLYAGRDLIIVHDFMKKPEALNSSDLRVSYASPYYKLIKSEEIKKVIEAELNDADIPFNCREKKESISDFACLYELESGKGILVRNSYIPSRALSVSIAVKKSIYIPVLKLKIIHTDKEIRKYELKLKEKLEKFTIVTDVIGELEKEHYEFLPEKFLADIEETSYVKYVTKKGFTEEKKILIGKEILEKAKEENWSALKLIEMFLVKCYRTNRYTLKRKADNIVLQNFEEILASAIA